MRKPLIIIITLVLCVCALSQLLGSCRKFSPTKGLTVISQSTAPQFPTPVYQFSDNPLTKEGFELGRKLFYDGRLSIDNLHSCSSCHQQIAGFGTFDHDRSHGVNNTHTLRNAPVLFNLAWNKSFHWDGEFSTLASEAMHPIHGSHEMGETMNNVLVKLTMDPNYRKEFLDVFKSPFIRGEFVLKALAQFTGNLVSADSKYDRYKAGTATFTVQEENGYQLFKTNCASCHPEPLFTDQSFRNTGLAIDPGLNDYGRIRITGRPEDSMKFKVPTLRNTYVSNNYMHDGRFNTLAQCIDHYRTGIVQSTTLDPSLTSGINLTDAERSALVVFLRTLTDSSFLQNPAFSKPN